MVLWLISVLGRWELLSHRSTAWAVGGSVALVAVAAGRIGAPSPRRAVIGLAGAVGCGVATGLLWHRAGQQSWPLGASAAGFVALVAGGAALLADDLGRLALLRRAGPAGAVNAAAVAAAVVVAAVVVAGVATAGWDDRPVTGHLAAGPVPAGPDPGALTREGASTSLTSANVAGIGPGGVYVAAVPGPRALIEALDPATGRVRWSWSRPSYFAAPTVAAGSGVVTVTFGGGEAVLDAVTGRERATFATPFAGALQGPPVVLGDQVIFYGRGDLVRSYSTATGSLLWSHAGAPAGCGGSAPPQGAVALPGGAISTAVLYSSVEGSWIYEVLSPGSDRLADTPVLRSVDLATGATGAQLTFSVGTQVQALEPTPGGTFVVVTNVGSLNMAATQILTGYR